MQYHVSMVRMYHMCGLRYDFRYNQGIKRPPNRYALRGRGAHKTIDMNMKSVIDTGAMLPERQVSDIARDTVVELWDGGYGVLLPRKTTDGEKKALLAETTDSAIALAKLHYSKVAPNIRPTCSERPWTLKIKGYDYTLGGTIDIQEGRRIRDTKTATKSPAANEANRSWQLTTYAMAVNAIDGFIPECSQDYLVDLKSGPKPVTQDTTRTVKDFKQILMTNQKMHMAIQAGIFLRAPEGVYYCSEDYCGWWPLCEFGGK